MKTGWSRFHMLLLAVLGACGDDQLLRIDPQLIACAPPLDRQGDNCNALKTEPIVQFGETIVGFAKHRGIRLQSSGERAVTVRALRWLDNPDQAYSLPVFAEARLAPGAELVVDIGFLPTLAGDQTARLAIDSDDPDRPHQELILAGKATADCHRVRDQYLLPAAPSVAVDILFVIDDSASMQGTQKQVKQKIHAFIEKLATQGLDYRIGVTTTDLTSGRRLPGRLVIGREGTKVVKPGPDAALEFARLMEMVDTNGANDEFGFLSARIALTPRSDRVSYDVDDGVVRFDGVGARDPDFYRDDARLAVVIISDEDDGGTPSSEHQRPEAYAAFFRSLKADAASQLRVVAIVDPSAGPHRGCLETLAVGGAPRYHTGIAALGGMGKVIDYCTDFADALSVAGDFVAPARCVFVPGQVGFAPDENPSLGIDGGPSFSASDWLWTPPSADHPHGAIQLTGDCPRTSELMTLDYAACLRMLDDDRDSVPNLVDNCPSAPNGDQSDENYDGAGDLCL